MPARALWLSHYSIKPLNRPRPNQQMPARALWQMVLTICFHSANLSKSTNAREGIMTKKFSHNPGKCWVQINKCPRGHYDLTRMELLSYLQLVQINKCPRGHYDFPRRETTSGLKTGVQINKCPRGHYDILPDRFLFTKSRSKSTNAREGIMTYRIIVLLDITYKVQINKCPRGHYDVVHVDARWWRIHVQINKCPRGHYDWRRS